MNQTVTVRITVKRNNWVKAVDEICNAFSDPNGAFNNGSLIEVIKVDHPVGAGSEWLVPTIDTRSDS